MGSLRIKNRVILYLNELLCSYKYNDEQLRQTLSDRLTFVVVKIHK